MNFQKYKTKKMFKSTSLKYGLIFVLCFLLILCVVTAFAHSGDTDSNGGHYNGTTGEYHYHHGHPEHQHRNGECPYDSLWRYLLPILLLIAGFFSFFMWCWISASLPNKVILNFEKAILNYKNAIQNTNFYNKQLKAIIDKAIIPDGYEIGKDGLPKEIDGTNYNDGYEVYTNGLPNKIESIRINWGKSLTVYTVHNGWKLHLNADCCGQFSKRNNIYEFYNKRYSLCQKCAENYNIPNMDWYIEYLKIAPQEERCKRAKKEQDLAFNNLKNCYSDCEGKLTKFLLFFSVSNKNKLNELTREYNKLINQFE